MSQVGFKNLQKSLHLLSAAKKNNKEIIIIKIVPETLLTGCEFVYYWRKYAVDQNAVNPSQIEQIATVAIVQPESLKKDQKFSWLRPFHRGENVGFSLSSV